MDRITKFTSLFLSFYREQADLPSDKDSDKGVLGSSLAKSSSRMATDPSPTQVGVGKVTSRSTPLAPNAGGETDVLMDEANTSAVEENVKDQGKKVPTSQEGPVLKTSATPAPAVLESQGRQGASPALSTKDRARRAHRPCSAMEGPSSWDANRKWRPF